MSERQVFLTDQAPELPLTSAEFARMAKTTPSGAVIIGPYRYALWRRWGPGPTIVFVMLNPSKADALIPDPTLTRCIGFAKDLGAGGVVLVNLFAFRATEPNDLLVGGLADKVGPLNDAFLITAAALAVDGGKVICAWGTHRATKDHGVMVGSLLTYAGVDLYCLRTTKAGHPSHPLYLPAALRPVLWKSAVL